MKEEQVTELILYRLGQAKETLREGDVLAQEGLWHGVVNRAYYAMFYATLALTVYRSQSISKHTGVISFFDKEFVLTGVFPREYSRMLHLAFERRQNNDYGEFMLVDEGEAIKALSEAKAFVEIVSKYLESVTGQVEGLSE